jgi:hypothetical protein
MIKMFGILLFTMFLFTFLVLAQNGPADAAGTPGCGVKDIKFHVKTEKGPHPAQLNAEKALVYIIEDDSDFGSFPKPTTRIGVDGNWVGATHGNSYFSFFVDPGIHHLCANWQSVVLLTKGRKTAAAHFTAAAGGAYYFQIKNTYWLDHGSAGMTLKPLDSDQGQLLGNTFPLSIPHEK